VAVIWRKTVGDKRYEVRSAGATRRLYTGGVCHSQFNPNHPVSGTVWDLLMLPAFFYPTSEIRRVLVLGVGGGAAISQLLRFVHPASIVGVELDPVHLYVARRFFGLEHPAVELHQADAGHWAKAYTGAKFDMIIDDLYTDEDGEPVRTVHARARWWDVLTGLLSSEGVLVANFVSVRELHASAYFHSRRVARRFPCAFQLTLPNYFNAVGAFLRKGSTPTQLRSNLTAVPGLKPDLKSTRLRYRIRRI
jgi:spermidine synthase